MEITYSATIKQGAYNMRKINSLRRFASGKRIGRTEENILADHGYISRDMYGSWELTSKGAKVLVEES